MHFIGYEGNDMTSGKIFLIIADIIIFFILTYGCWLSIKQKKFVAAIIVLTIGILCFLGMCNYYVFVKP